MDFSSLRYVDVNLDTPNDNSTSLPSALMEALIPGYRIVYQIVFRLFGIDIGLVVSGCIIALALGQGVLFLYKQSSDCYQAHFTSTVHIDESGVLLKMLMDWLAYQRVSHLSRSLQADARPHRLEPGFGPDEDEFLDEQGIFNYDQWISRVPLQYSPWYGTDSFRFQARVFTFLRERRETKKHGERDSITIRCSGRSVDPIKHLLDHVRAWKRPTEVPMTMIFRPEPNMCSDRCWLMYATRPSRPMSTISLDAQSKSKMIWDINEFILPATRRWYAARGIPYRRGYLFHGPPGTGKSSLSFALAGIFGMQLYCLSLNEGELTDSILSTLFDGLPSRCIILLEDIDAVGLSRAEPLEVTTLEDDHITSSSSNHASQDGSTMSKEPDQNLLPKQYIAPSTQSQVSMSGLLNAIDGAAAHEGHILIMTTNHPEALDDALIRPGRVDLQVAFTLATRDQAHDIFLRMYNTEHDVKEVSSRKTETLRSNGSTCTSTNTKTTNTTPPPSTAFDTKPRNTNHELVPNRPAHRPTRRVGEDPEKLQELASSFAAQIPEAVFSPAELQGFLLQLKFEPSRAVEEVRSWRDDLLEAKRKGSRVVGGAGGR